MIKHKHHYVWGKYLRAWSMNDQIFCKRNSNIFQTNIVNIANKRDFYNINDLSDEDIIIIKKLFIDASTYDSLRELNNNWVKIFDFVLTFRRKVLTQGIPESMKEEFENKVINFEEELQCTYENIGSPYLDRIKNGDITFYNNIDDNINFNLFICMQYFRTKNIENEITKASKDFPLFRTERTWKILTHIFATNLANSLYLERNEYKCILLVNKTGIPFITGDQPVVNTFADYTTLPKNPPEELEFYYPQSPEISILITKKEEYRFLNIRDLNIQEVNEFNKMIANASEEQLYSNRRDILRHIVI